MFYFFLLGLLLEAIDRIRGTANIPLSQDVCSFRFMHILTALIHGLPYSGKQKLLVLPEKMT